MRVMVPKRQKKSHAAEGPVGYEVDPKTVDMAFHEYGSIQWIDKLIELVLGRQELYNHAHPDYRNIARRDLIWESIAVNLQTTAADVKKRWRSLRDTFSRIVRNRQKRGVPDRGGASKKWTWTDKMEPLLSFLPPSTLGEGDLDSSSILEVHIDDSGSATLDSVTERLKRDPDDCHSENGDFARQDNYATSEHDNYATSSTGKRPYPSDSEDRTFAVYYENGKLAKMDPIDLLFLAHASTVKTFSARRQAITKLKVAEVIMQEELNNQADLESNETE